MNTRQILAFGLLMITMASAGRCEAQFDYEPPTVYMERTDPQEEDCVAKSTAYVNCAGIICSLPLMGDPEQDTDANEAVFELDPCELNCHGHTGLAAPQRISAVVTDEALKPDTPRTTVMLLKGGGTVRVTCAGAPDNEGPEPAIPLEVGTHVYELSRTIPQFTVLGVNPPGSCDKVEDRRYTLRIRLRGRGGSAPLDPDVLHNFVMHMSVTVDNNPVMTSFVVSYDPIFNQYCLTGTLQHQNEDKTVDDTPEIVNEVSRGGFSLDYDSEMVVKQGSNVSIIFWQAASSGLEACDGVHEDSASHTFSYLPYLEVDVTDEFLAGDANQDGVVNLLDVAEFVAMVQSGEYNPLADINRDCAVDLLDVDCFTEMISGCDGDW